MSENLVTLDKYTKIWIHTRVSPTEVKGRYYRKITTMDTISGERWVRQRDLTLYRWKDDIWKTTKEPEEEEEEKELNIHEYTFFTPYRVEARTWLELEEDEDPEDHIDEAKSNVLRAFNRFDRGFRTSQFQETLEFDYTGVRRHEGNTNDVVVFRADTGWNKRVSHGGRMYK